MNRFIYKGCVEDNQDPECLGRVKVRILGIHSHNKEEVKTNDLSWCNPAWAITGSSNSGIGDFKPPLKGSWVLCLPEDDGMQRWIYFATISSFTRETSNTDLGFNDPDGIYPLENRINEPDVNRLATNRKIENTPVQIKIDEKITNIKTASLRIEGPDITNFTKATDAGTTYFEPQEPYATEYPNSRVIETEPKSYKFGHTIEMDDTDGKERLTISHKAGSWESIHYNGQRVKKTISDSYYFNMENCYKFTAKDEHKTVWRDYRLIVKRNHQKEIYGYERNYIKGSQINYVSGNIGTWVGAQLVDDPTDPNYEIIGKKIDESDKKDPVSTTPEVNSIGGSYALLVEDNQNEKIKSNWKKVVNGTAYIEVAGSKNQSTHKVGTPGDMTIEPHNKFLVKAQNISDIRGLKQKRSHGAICGASVCPMTMFPHQMKSLSTKVSFP